MRHAAEKTYMIAGAASGIGAVIATKLALTGNRVVLALATRPNH